MPNNQKFEGTELEKFLERYEVDRIRDNFKDRVITIVVASLGLISALAWDDALKRLFEKLFGSSATLSDQILYAIIITIVAAIISVYLGKVFNRKAK